MTIVYLALGTNLGDRRANLGRALERLGERVPISVQSRVYETEPWGVLDQPRFLNMAVEGETELRPEELLGFLKTIERELGRKEGLRYGPRLIDLDILFYGDSILHSDDLVIPHPRLPDRRFVLVPLAEIAPERVHPELGLTIRQLLARLPDRGDVVPINTSPGSSNRSR